MHELVFLKSLVIVLGISAAVVFALHRLKIPSVVGFLLGGMLMGPYSLNFVSDIGSIQTLAEIGVILLLFTIGLEFSLSRFLKMKLEVFGIGGLQVALSASLTTLIFLQLSGIDDTGKAVFMGFLVALSSTAIVMKVLSDRAELDAPHGRISVGTLIFQDLCVVPFMLFIPILSGGAKGGEIALTVGKAAAIIAAVIFLSRRIVPALLLNVVRTRSRELFIIAVLIICFGTAFITSEFGLSLALGAFLAGLVISESEYSHEAASAVIPFSHSFSGLFFISVGMLMDMSFFMKHIFSVIALVGGIIILKFTTGVIAMYLMKRPLRVTLQSSLCLAQVGEFSFVLAVAGLSAGLISEDNYQTFLSASVLTMLITPFFIQVAPSFAGRLSSVKLLSRLEGRLLLSQEITHPEKRSGHTIIVGFGLNGRNLARVMKSVNIPYMVLELNISTVREMEKQGEPMCYGDGTKIEVLHNLGVRNARILVVAISDPASCRQIVKTSRKENPDLFIIARTRYTSEVEELLDLGADEVIPEEFETSVEIFSRVLNRYGIPRNEIYNYVDMIREDGYQALRQTSAVSRKQIFEKDTVLSRIEVEQIVIRDTSPVIGKSISELGIRKKTGATVVAVEQGDQFHTSPDPEFVFKAGDVVFITGKREVINKALVYLTEERRTH